MDNFFFFLHRLQRSLSQAMMLWVLCLIKIFLNETECFKAIYNFFPQGKQKHLRYEWQHNRIFFNVTIITVVGTLFTVLSSCSKFPFLNPCLLPERHSFGWRGLLPMQICNTFQNLAWCMISLVFDPHQMQSALKKKIQNFIQASMC